MKLSSKKMNTSLKKIDATVRAFAGGISSTLETGTPLKVEWQMWALIGLGVLAALFVTPGASLFAIVAAVAALILPESLLGHGEMGAKLRLGASAALIAFTVLAGGLLNHWPLYLVLTGVWVGSANWKKPSPPPAE